MNKALSPSPTPNSNPKYLFDKDCSLGSVKTCPTGTLVLANLLMDNTN